MSEDHVKYLSALTASLVTASKDDPPNTKSFTLAMDKVLPVFDHMGSVLAFAQNDMIVKVSILVQNDSLKKVTQEYPTLDELVEADKQAGTVTKKNSLARNLHRLRTVVHFIKQMMLLLAQNSDMALSTAVSEAYKTTLGPYHSTIVRGTCQAGFLLLPTREAFLTSIGETEESGTAAEKEVVEAAEAVMKNIDKLFDGIEMPVSTAWL